MKTTVWRPYFAPLAATAFSFFCLSTAAADLVVTNSNSQGAGSLSAAITAANQDSSLKTISFNLPGPGPWTITINSTLFITAPVVVDGTSQAGFDGSFNRIYVEGASGVSSIFLR